MGNYEANDPPWRSFRPTVSNREAPRKEHVSLERIFRLRAPEANTVSLSFGRSKPDAKDASGVWTATAGPMASEIYQFNFVVDGLSILDPGNPTLKNGRPLDASIAGQSAALRPGASGSARRGTDSHVPRR